MITKHTISINGQLYDAVTGLPVNQGAKIQPATAMPSVAPQPKPKLPPNEVERTPSHPAVAVHQQVRKSTTLRRAHLVAPENKAVSAPIKRTSGHIARSPMISRFASHPQPFPKNHEPKMINDIGPIAPKPVLAKSAPTRSLSSREIKEKLIARAGTTVDHHVALQKSTPKSQKKPRLSFLKRLSKRHFLTAGTAVILLLGYITYLSMPGLSVRLAAAQSGVNARYPEYNPDGYSFKGPVAFQQGEVELHFASNGGGEGYTIRQRSSDWNSIAVLDNLVSKQSGGDYQTNSQGGITVYTYGNRAAWTNGGVLYTIEGKAPLSNEQILRIASSM